MELFFYFKSNKRRKKIVDECFNLFSHWAAHNELYDVKLNFILITIFKQLLFIDQKRWNKIFATAVEKKDDLIDDLANYYFYIKDNDERN